MAERRIRSPIVLLGAPRSGTTMLFNVLSAHPDLWSLYAESGTIIDRWFPTTMTVGDSDVITASDVSDEAVADLQGAFARSIGNMGSRHVALSQLTSRVLRTPVGRFAARFPLASRARLSTLYSRAGRHQGPSEVRMVEKTPLNCLRIPLMNRLFPDCRFVHLTRDPRPSVASIYTGWTQSTEFRRFRFPPWFRLAGDDAGWWCFGLIPGWEELNGVRVIDICARQWSVYNEYCRRDLPDDADRTMRVTYEDLVAEPGPVLAELAKWAELDPSPFDRFNDSLPVINTRTAPHLNKWRELEAQIESIEEIVQEEASALGYRS